MGAAFQTSSRWQWPSSSSPPARWRFDCRPRPRAPRHAAGSPSGSSLPRARQMARSMQASWSCSCVESKSCVRARSVHSRSSPWSAPCCCRLAALAARRCLDICWAVASRHYLTVRGEVIVHSLTNLLCFFCLTVLGKIHDLRAHDRSPIAPGSCLPLRRGGLVAYLAVVRSPDGAISAFTRVFDALWRHPGSARHNRPRMRHPGFRFAQSGLLATARSARCVLDRGFEALRVEGRHTLDPPQVLGGVPDGKREHCLRIRGIDDVDEVVVALRVVDRLDLDAQFVELCLGLLDSLRLFACVLGAQISKQHIFHGYLHVMWIVLREDLATIGLLATNAHGAAIHRIVRVAPTKSHHEGEESRNT